MCNYELNSLLSRDRNCLLTACLEEMKIEISKSEGIGIKNMCKELEDYVKESEKKDLSKVNLKEKY